MLYCSTHVTATQQNKSWVFECFDSASNDDCEPIFFPLKTLKEHHEDTNINFSFLGFFERKLISLRCFNRHFEQTRQAKVGPESTRKLSTCEESSGRVKQITFHSSTSEKYFFFLITWGFRNLIGIFEYIWKSNFERIDEIEVDCSNVQSSVETIDIEYTESFDWKFASFLSWNVLKCLLKDFFAWIQTIINRRLRYLMIKPSKWNLFPPSPDPHYLWVHFVLSSENLVSPTSLILKSSPKDLEERKFEIPRKPRNLYSFSPSDIQFETVTNS